MKTFEVRDRMTFIPVLAFRLDPKSEEDRFLMARAGYGLTTLEQRQYVAVWALNGGRGMCTTDPHDWGNRTLTTAHKYIAKHFDELESGSVVDVEFILGESKEPKVTERVEIL